MKRESICFKNWQSKLWAALKHLHTSRHRLWEDRGQSACPSTNCQFSRSLQSSRSLQPRAEVSRMCSVLPVSQLNIWAGPPELVESIYITVSYLGKLIMSFPSDWREGRDFLLFFFFYSGREGAGSVPELDKQLLQPAHTYKRSGTDVGEDGNNDVLCCHTEVPRVLSCSSTGKK